MLLRKPGVFLDPGPGILFVKLCKSFKGHIHIGCVLKLEGTLPLLRLPLGGEAPLAFLLVFALPVVVPGHYIPGTVVLVLIHGHCYDPPFRVRRPFR